jgi:hypothetical protein
MPVQLPTILILLLFQLAHTTQSILTAVEQYSMGKERPLEEYLRIVGMNMTTKEITNTQWCERGYPPPGFEKYRDLYPAGRALARQGIA